MLRHWDSLPSLQKKEITRRLEAGELVKHFDEIVSKDGKKRRAACPQMWPVSRSFWEGYSGLSRTPTFSGYGVIDVRTKLAWLDHLGLREQGVREAYLYLWSALDAELSRFAEEQEEERKANRGK